MMSLLLYFFTPFRIYKSHKYKIPSIKQHLYRYLFFPDHQKCSLTIIDRVHLYYIVY